MTDQLPDEYFANQIKLYHFSCIEDTSWKTDLKSFQTKHLIK